MDKQELEMKIKKEAEKLNLSTHIEFSSGFNFDLCQQFDAVEVYETVQEYVEAADVSNYKYTGPVDQEHHIEKVYLQELENFQEITGNTIEIGGNPFVQVNWGENEIVFIPEDYYLEAFYILYQMQEETEYGYMDGVAYPSLFTSAEEAEVYAKQ